MIQFHQDVYMEFDQLHCYFWLCKIKGISLTCAVVRESPLLVYLKEWLYQVNEEMSFVLGPLFHNLQILKAPRQNKEYRCTA